MHLNINASYSAQRKNQISHALRLVMETQRSTSTLSMDKKLRNNWQERRWNMITKKEFRSTKRKSFHFINHSILGGTRNITNTAHMRTAQTSLIMSNFLKKKQRLLWSNERSDLTQQNAFQNYKITILLGK